MAYMYASIYDNISHSFCCIYMNNNYSFLGDVHMIQLIAQVTIQNMSKRDNIKIKLSVLEENEEEEVILHTSLIHQISHGIK